MSSYDYVIPKYGGDLARNNDDYEYEYEIFIALTEKHQGTRKYINKDIWIPK